MKAVLVEIEQRVRLNDHHDVGWGFPCLSIGAKCFAQQSLHSIARYSPANAPRYGQAQAMASTSAGVHMYSKWSFVDAATTS